MQVVHYTFSARLPQESLGVGGAGGTGMPPDPRHIWLFPGGAMDSSTAPGPGAGVEDGVGVGFGGVGAVSGRFRLPPSASLAWGGHGPSTAIATKMAISISGASNALGPTQSIFPSLLGNRLTIRVFSHCGGLNIDNTYYG